MGIILTNIGYRHALRSLAPKNAFSLVELLVTLIILSIIIAAFIPLIAKKLKASDITVGSFGSSGGGAIGITRNVTKEDCDKLNAVFVEASTNVPKPLCVLKYNIGDMGNENWAGVQRCQAGSNCKVSGGGENNNVSKDTLQATCWQGITANSDHCNDKFGGYSGCTRTVCNWTGANQMCSNYSLKGISGWRLPTNEELISFAKDKYSNKDIGANGLMLCLNTTSSDTSPLCAGRGMVGSTVACVGDYYGNCHADAMWSSRIDPKDSAKAQIGWLYLDSEQMRYLNYAISGRCVLDSISDIVPPDGGTDLIDNKLDSQGDCDKLGAGLLFISKEDTGTKNMCVMKYNIGDMGNENWAGVQKCITGAACTVEGGGKDVTNETKDTLQPTCWQGKTAADGCDAKYGSYSGCNRTVCNWTGANKMCENYRLGTYGWRLPTFNELKSFANSTFSNKDKGAKGLMFCDYLTNSEAAPICFYRNVEDGACVNSSAGYCHPNILWTSDILTNSSSKAQSWGLNSTWADSTNYLGFAVSSRCVLDEDAYRHANTNQIMPTETEFSSSCDTGCALCGNDKCYACKQGYELNNGKCITHCLTMNNGTCVACKKDYALLNGKCLTCDPSNGFVKVGNLCVMQYNIGDGYYKEKWNGVQKCITKNSCTVVSGNSKEVKKENLTPTCWQGKTAADGCNASFGGYSGCNRTLCNWTGANQMCTNVGWRLPTLDELKTFTDDKYSSKTAYESGNGSLMFCDLSTSSSTSPVCPFLPGGCSGTFYGNCNSYHIWSSSFKTDSIAWSRYLGNVWADYADYLSLGFFARCVYDL